MNALIIGGSGGLSSVLAVKAMESYKVYTVTRGERKLPEGDTKDCDYAENKRQMEYDLSKLRRTGVKMP